MSHLPHFLCSGVTQQAFRARQTPQFESTELQQIKSKRVQKRFAKLTQMAIKEEEEEERGRSWKREDKGRMEG